MARLVPLLIVVLTCLAAGACASAGRKAYLAAGCEECHGLDLRGTMTGGPALRNTKQHWDVERLLRYFADPDGVALMDERLRALRSRYGSGMPPIKLADPDARRALARYVLR
jgi:cytochrome c2